ncbi:MAG: hypothetical protein WC648_00240 [Candidatus Paceibacterota bacterium]
MKKRVSPDISTPCFEIMRLAGVGLVQPDEATQMVRIAIRPPISFRVSIDKNQKRPRKEWKGWMDYTSID